MGPGTRARRPPQSMGQRQTSKIMKKGSKRVGTMMMRVSTEIWRARLLGDRSHLNAGPSGEWRRPVLSPQPRITETAEMSR